MAPKGLRKTLRRVAFVADLEAFFANGKRKAYALGYSAALRDVLSNLEGESPTNERRFWARAKDVK